MNFEIKAKKALDLEKGQGFIIAHGFRGGYNEILQNTRILWVGIIF